MTVPIKIRAHHLLCMQGFQGYGYSESFVDYLNSIITQLKSNPDMLVQVVIDCDNICVGCPHQNENICQKDSDSDYRIKLMDSKILKYTGINPKSIDSIKSMITCINNTFKARSELADVCGDCQWTEKCTWYLSLA